MRQEMAKDCDKKGIAGYAPTMPRGFLYDEILNDGHVCGGRPFLTLLNFKIDPVTLI